MRFARIQIDDIYELPDGRLLLTDYKVPTEKALYNLVRSDPVVYSGQVTLGKMLAREAGIKIDLMSIAVYDHTNFKIEPIEVDANETFEKEIEQVGNYYYDLMLKGEIPPPPIPKYAIHCPMELPDEIRQTIHELQVVKSLASEAELAATRLSEQLEPTLLKLEQSQTHNFKLSVRYESNRQKC